MAPPLLPRRSAACGLLALILCACSAAGVSGARRAKSPPPPSKPPSPPAAPTPKYWSLLWADEFARTKPLGGTAAWRAMLGDGSQYGIQGWGNSEHSFYTDRSENVRIEGGHLVIQALHKPFAPAGQQFTSARIRTAGRYAISPSAANKRVRIEARMKLTPGMGLWPAFWMLPDDNPYSTCVGCGVYGGWAQSGELDIMEMKNAMSQLIGSLHFGGQWPANVLMSSDTQVPLGTEAGWHTFAVEWEAKRIRWFLDASTTPFFTAYSGNGTCAMSVEGISGWCSNSATATPDAPFDRPFHLILNMAIGSPRTAFTNYQSDETLLNTLRTGCGTAASCQTRVDWVRVYGCSAGPDEPCLGLPLA